MKRIKKESYLLVFIFIVAILTRVYNDPMSPFHYDPGKNIVYTRAILDSFPLFPQYNSYFNLGEYYEYQVLFPYTVALLNKMTGLSLVVLTSWSIIIIGSLLPITVFILSKEIFNNIPIALISAGLVAISKIQLFSYMNYYPQIMALTILPLAFWSIIRYTRISNKKYIIYTSILSAAIILSSYLVGMVYLSILTLSLLIYSIMKKETIYITDLIIITVLTSALTAFYTLPIINRYGINTFIAGIIDTIFTKKDVPFTNVPIDILIPAAFKFIIIISIVICVSLAIYLFGKRSKLEISKLEISKLEISKLEISKLEISKLTRALKEIKYEYILLVTWTSISLVLVESYIFRPILWVDRYVEFLDIAITILAGYSIYFILNKMRYNKSLGNYYKIIQALILVLIFAYPIHQVIVRDYGFGYWNTPNDLESLNWVQNNIQPDALFATPSGITSFWVSALGGIHVLGGESSQMLGERFDGNGYSDTIINSPNVTEKMDIIRRFGVQFVYITVRPSIRSLLWKNEYNIEGLKAFENKTYFEFVHKKEDKISNVYIIKIKENLSPKYNAPKTYKWITILGYAISLFTLVIMIRLIIRKNVEEYNRRKLTIGVEYEQCLR